MTNAENNLKKITEALNPVFDALKTACIRSLELGHENIAAKLAENGWDFKLAFPMPKAWGCSTADYRGAMASRESASRAVTADKAHPAPRFFDDPQIVKMRADLAETRETEASKYARTFIDSYAAKLTAKITKEDKTFEVEIVEYTGTKDPFSNSRLTVTGSGRTMTWKTKCILNVSKYGKLFNQWPTRKTK